MSTEATVSQRYSAGAEAVQDALCCPVDYDASLLKLLPEEIIAKDYGCGDPSRYVRDGDHVLDLGSGGGKICYMAAQLVGSKGSVTGVDMTDAMLALARKYQGDMDKVLDGVPVQFRKGYIQDLALDVEGMEAYLQESPVADLDSLNRLEAWKRQQRSEQPMIADGSVTLVISNCVLNLVDNNDRQQLIEGIFRVLQPGGRVAISDIVCDAEVPAHLQNDPELWSGCISGAFHEQGFLQAFVDAGFCNVGYDKWETDPWRVVEGIEFRSVTLIAEKPARTDLYDAGQAVIYKGPFTEVFDDLGNRYPRGERIAVSKRTHDLIANGILARHFVCMTPPEEENHGCFCLPAGTKRTAQQTRGGAVMGGESEGPCC